MFPDPAAQDAPRTRESLAADLRALGVQAGEVLIVQSSLSALGWVSGGAVAVIQALQDVLTPAGTLVMSGQSTNLTDPSRWRNPPVPEAWWETVRATMPAYDPATTPTRGVGIIPEQFRTWPGVLRSDHPHSSWSAWGAHAEAITAPQPLEHALGEGSPIARVYDLGGRVLLLGTQRNTSLHLAEVRSGARGTYREGAPLLVDGKRQWVTFDETDYDDDTFPPVKAAFEATGAVRIGKVGSAESRLMSQRAAVDFAEAWFRGEAGKGRPEIAT